jgi:hypothetical protein
MAIQIQRRETYSSPLVNYIEPYNIFGVDYTRFYTEINTELSVNDYVYILNGNYDNSNLIDQNEYQRGTTGYKILEIDKNSIVLDIPFRTEKPFEVDNFEDYTKVYLVDSVSKFNYENIDNGFGFDLFTGDKYSTQNNNIFLSQIENMSYTNEIQTKDKFFKSNLFDGVQVESTGLRGQVINDTTSLNWELEETTVYGLTPSGTGSSSISFGVGKNFVKDFDLLTNSSLDKMVVLTSVNLSSDANLWTWDKKTREVFDVEIHSSIIGTSSVQIDAHYVKPFETGYETLFSDKNDIRIKCPANLDGTYSMSGYIGLTISTTNGVDLFEYDVEGMSQTLVLGYSGATASNNFRSFGFYNNNATSSYMIPSIDNELGTINKELALDYAQIGATYTTPYFVLCDNGTYSSYFPVNTNGDVFNVVPEYAKFSGIGSPVKVEINDWINTNDQSQNLEYCFAGEKVEGASDDALQGGLYFYSYTGNYEDTNGDKFIGNAFELSQTTLDKYYSGSWMGLDSFQLLNPFVGMSYAAAQLFLNDIKDVKWLGIEKKNFSIDLAVTDNGETAIYPSSNGIYYSKYLVISSNDAVPDHYVYVNFNFELLRVNSKIEETAIAYGMPQVHCIIESIQSELSELALSPSVIGSNRTQDGDIYPYILDGKYVLGQVNGGDVIQFPINESFGFTFEDTSVTDFDYNDQRWIIGAGATSPRITNTGVIGIGKGLYVYDELVSLSVEHITTGTTFSVGDNLPSNEVFKVRGEVIDGQRRVWVATNDGVFMYDSSQVINSEYYYKVDIDNNELPLDSNLYKNNRLFIMEDFIYDGIDYKKGDICKWINEDRRWEIDVTYLQPYLSKAHFEDGSFLTSGILDDGMFGNRDTVAKWLGGGAEWRNGILYNSDWLDGTMKSKSDELIEQSYYSLSKNSQINNTTDFTNNNTYGYNKAIKSTILGGVIDNGNFDSCIIGDMSITGLLDGTYSGSGFTYSNIVVDQGYFLHSDIYSSVVNNSKIESSSFNSSSITDSSRIISSNSSDSIIDDATIENKGKIKITGYDKWYNIKRDLVGIDIIHVHKFFIDEKDFRELEYGDPVIFNNITTNSNGVTDILNSLFYVIGGTAGYYGDVYEDLNKIKNYDGVNSIEYSTNSFKLFISKKLKTQNAVKSTIVYSGYSDLSVVGVVNDTPRYSIDLSIIVANIPHQSAPELYLSAIKDNSILKFTAIDVTSATIQTKHFNNSWVNGGEWLNGSVVSPNQTSHKFDRGTMSVIDNSGTKMVKMYVNDVDYEIKIDELYSVGDVMSIVNLWDTSFGTYVGGNFKIVTINTTGAENYLILDPYEVIGLTASTILTQPISQYKFINSNRFDGVGNRLKIKTGLFKNQSFENLEFNSKSLITTYEDVNTRSAIDINKDNKKLVIINSEITNINDVTIKNGFFVYGQLSSDFGSSDNASGELNSYKQVFSHFDINGGEIIKSAFLDGEFNKGLFTDNKYDESNDIIPINNNTIDTTQTGILPVWVSGNFNQGMFTKSVWMSGNFNNGKFSNSEFLGGVFNNGIFGDKSSKSTLNAFRKGTFNNGIFENGIFGDNIKRIDDINSVYYSGETLPSAKVYIKTGTNIWNNGNFNNGIFTTIDDNVSIWNDGNFNNGQVLDSVIWYDGIFNNGKFKSVYGRQVSNIVGEVDLDSISTDSDITSGNVESGSRTVNLFTHYLSNLDFLNQYNIATIRDKHVKNKFDNPGTLIFDKYDNQIKYTFISNNYTSIVGTWDDDNSAHGYGEKKLDIFYGATPSPPAPFNLGLQFKSIDYLSDDLDKRNPLYESKVLGAKIFIQDTGNEYVYDGGQYITASTFLGATISGTSVTYSSTYAWRAGVFNNGEFGGENNFNNDNPSWEGGTFNGGKFFGKVWKDGTFIRGDFNGSGVEQPSIIDRENIYIGYDPQNIVERYLNDFSNVVISTNNATQSGYKTVLDSWGWYGLWLNGDVLSNVNELDTISDRVNENTLVEYFKKDKFKRSKPIISNFNNVLWVGGTFNNNDGNFNQSVWLSGSFNNGSFNDSMFNPYVQRWNFESGDLTNLKFSFELDTKLSVWNNGRFNSGVFYYSDWNNGTFEYGTMVGGLFKKGISNYMSAFSSIWEGGRWRNGNWYGSNFTISNESADISVPNPFSYLSEGTTYFDGVTYPPFITDILSNNADRLQDDRLHIWNIIGGTSSNSPFDLTSHELGVDYHSELNGESGVYPDDSSNNKVSSKLTTPNVSDPDSVTDQVLTFRLDDVSDSGQLSTGKFEFEFEVASELVLLEQNNSETAVSTNTDTPDGSLYYNIDMSLSDDVRFVSGIYKLYFYTGLRYTKTSVPVNRWQKFTNLDYMTLTVSVDKYEDGIFIESDIIRFISQDVVDNVTADFTIEVGWEYVLKLRYQAGVNPIVSGGTTTSKSAVPAPISGDNPDDFIDSFYIDVESFINEVSYTEDNNTLHGYIEPTYDTNYLNSIISTISGTLSYIGNVTSKVIDYCSYDIATISIPTIFPSISGAFAQYGNGVFLEGIWENGVWNNGYRGTQFGTTIIDDPSTLPGGSNSDSYPTDTFTYGSGATASVLLNQLYTESTEYQWKTSPTIYFNKVQRSFKTTKNTWRFVLESAFNINASELFTYNKLSIGDKISIGNIIAIDINGSRKIIKNLFTVVDLPTSNINRVDNSFSQTQPTGYRMTVEYKETFPINDIQIDSDRHLIYVQKNVWLYGSFLNGYFEGIMNGGYIRGNRELTKLIDSHLIDVKFEGGQLVGSKQTLASAFGGRYSEAQGLSPQFTTNYNGLYHSTVVQHMDFIDDMTPQTFTMQSIKGVTVSGVGGSKSVGYTSFGNTASAVKYLYNSDIDVVYEPEFFSSVYNQTIFNNNIIGEAVIGNTENTYMHNIPAGYITYDILSSDSQFRYSFAKHVFKPQHYNLNLGSKYKKYNTLDNVDFTTPTQKTTLDIASASIESSVVDTIPNTFNIVRSDKHDIQNRWFGGDTNANKNDGITFKLAESFDIHEEFMYTFGTSSDGTRVLSDSLIVANNDFITRGRYHIVEVDVEFAVDRISLNPYDIQREYTFDTTYTYDSDNLPKLTIGQGYNELYEHFPESVKAYRGYLSPYDNDFIPYIDGRKLSEINGFTESNRLTMKSFMYNNYGGYRDNVKIFQKDFDDDIGATLSVATIHSPIYYSVKHYEIDQIPFFRYQDFLDPLTGTASEWNMYHVGIANFDETRQVDIRVKKPFYATSVPIRYDDDSFILTENINFLGGNGVGDDLIIDIDVFNIINNIT